MLIFGVVLLVILQILAVIGAVATIGDERKPRTKNEAIASIIMSALIITLYIAIILRLSRG